MMTYGGQAWLTTLADLSIILFMVTATDLSNAEPKPTSAMQAAVTTAEPVAIYRPETGGVSLDSWLAGLPTDNRLRLTILVRHSGRRVDDAVARGLELGREAEQAGYSPRLVVEETERPDLVVSLAYDADAQLMARNLREFGHGPMPEDSR